MKLDTDRRGWIINSEPAEAQSLAMDLATENDGSAMPKERKCHYLSESIMVRASGFEPETY